MKVGRDLDALIAEKVMGWDVHRYPNGDVHCTDEGVDYWIGDKQYLAFVEMFAPSTNIADAWKVVEKIAQSHGEFYLEITKVNQKCFAMAGENLDNTATEDTMPLAICTAALKAVGYE